MARLTLDAAAAEAGLSKGGVLYHFPTRDALVAGMVAKIIEEFDRDIDGRLEDDEEPGRFLRAYIGATMEPGAPHPDRQDRLGAALIAAAAAQPELLRPLQEAADRWQDGAGARRAGPDHGHACCAWPATACGCATCSVWPPRPRRGARRWAGPSSSWPGDRS